MSKADIGKYFMSKEDFFDDAVDSETFNKVSIEIRDEESNMLVDESRIERDKTWSLLANQVVGSEEIVTCHILIDRFSIILT